MQAAFHRRPSAFLGALALDLLLGDPPTALHPVGWFGRVARVVEARAASSGPMRRRHGAIAAAALPVVAGAAAWACSRLAGRGGPPVALLTEAALLDTTFALGGLLGRADEVRVALEDGDLDRARTLLGRHLVSRDVRDLTASEVAGAAIESVAENLGDGVVAPWLAYAACGLPGAAAYRAVNTLDSMWGYRTVPYADFGFAAAKVDDAANWLPARIAAIAIAGAAAVAGEDAGGALDAWRRDRSATESPNAGHPMSAMAGALGVVLTKRGAYLLGAGGREPVAADIARAVWVARVAAALVAGVVVALASGPRRGRVSAGE